MQIWAVRWMIWIFILASILLPFTGEADTNPATIAQRGGGIEGTVVLSDGSSIPGVTVTLTGEKAGTWTTISSANGHFRFPSLPPGSYQLKFELEGFNTVIRENIKVRLGRNLQLDTTMNTATIDSEIFTSKSWPGVFKGTVTNKVTGRPVEVSTVTIYNKEKPTEPPRHVKKTPQGTYEIPNLPPGTYTAIAMGRCHEKVVKEVVIGPGTTVVDFQAENKPLKVVIELSHKEFASVVHGLDLSGVATLTNKKISEATGVDPDEIDWKRSYKKTMLEKDGRVIEEATVYFKDKTQGASGTTPPCIDTIPTETTETPTITTKPGNGFIETNILRKGKADAGSGSDDPFYSANGT